MDDYEKFALDQSRKAVKRSKKERFKRFWFDNWIALVSMIAAVIALLTQCF